MSRRTTMADPISDAAQRVSRVREKRRALDERNRQTDALFESVRPPPLTGVRTPHTPIPPPTIRQ